MLWHALASSHSSETILTSACVCIRQHTSALTCSGDTYEESDQFRFLRPVCLANLKGSVVLILAKTSGMRVSIPLDLSTRPFIPLPHFIRSVTPFSPLPSYLFLVLYDYIFVLVQKDQKRKLFHGTLKGWTNLCVMDFIMTS